MFKKLVEWVALKRQQADEMGQRRLDELKQYGEAQRKKAARKTMPNKAPTPINASTTLIEDARWGDYKPLYGSLDEEYMRLAGGGEPGLPSGGMEKLKEYF